MRHAMTGGHYPIPASRLGTPLTGEDRRRTAASKILSLFLGGRKRGVLNEAFASAITFSASQYPTVGYGHLTMTYI